MMFAIGGISGCHVNPAVTIGMLIVGKIKSKDALLYIIFQCIGAVIAAGILLIFASGQPGYSLEVNGLGQNGYGSLFPMKKRSPALSIQGSNQEWSME